MVILYLLVLLRHTHLTDSTYGVVEYGPTSGPSTLRTHLSTRHVEAWVDTCDRFKILITATAAQAAVAEYRRSKGEPVAAKPGPDERRGVPDYSPEAFLDAITEFIVADDQVRCSLRSGGSCSY